MSTTLPADDLVFHRVNTLEKLERLRGVASTVEIDLFLVRERLSILHHKDFGKTEKEIEQMPWKDLQHLTNDQAPLLEEYLRQAASWGIGVIIEIKGSSETSARTTTPRAIVAIAEMRRKGLFGNDADYHKRSLIIHSFSLIAMREAQQAMEQEKTPMAILLGWSSSPNIASQEALCSSSVDAARDVLRINRSQAIEAVPNAMWHESGITICARSGFSAIALRADRITPELVQLAHQHGVRINAYRTVDEDVDRLRAMGVDLITIELRS